MYLATEQDVHSVSDFHPWKKNWLLRVFFFRLFQLESKMKYRIFPRCLLTFYENEKLYFGLASLVRQYLAFFKPCATFRELIRKKGASFLSVVIVCLLFHRFFGH